MYRSLHTGDPVIVASRLSQPSSPQSGCPSPSIPAGKVISPSQKHSKKALKQALKQQQQQQRKKQQRRVGMPVPSSQHILLKTVKAASSAPPPKPAPAHICEVKRTEGQSSHPQILRADSSSVAKANDSLQGLGKKALQRSDRLQARHLKRTKCAEIDVETPDSILVNTNLRALINKHTFSLLPGECQQRLLLLLPEVDRQAGPDGLMKLSSSALNNEFFTSAAQSWKERLAEGELTPEMQLRIRQEIEKEKKVEPWKEQFYESYYGENSGLSLGDYNELTEETNENSGKMQTSPPAEPCKPEPCPKLLSVKAENEIQAGTKVDVKELRPAKNEEEKNDNQMKPDSADVTDIVPRPGKVLVNINVKAAAVSVQSEEVSAEGNAAGSIGKKMEAAKETPSTPESKETEVENQISLTPKSPNIVQTPRALTTKEKLHQDSSEVESADKAALVSSVGMKRKLHVGEDVLAGPEKCPRVIEQQQSFCALSKPNTAVQAQEQKVPPVKITVSCISPKVKTEECITPKPFLASRVSPRPCFPAAVTSPGRTGARTLADIKAKAQMARAQRAAAAAAAAATAASIGGSVPGPGPGGGAGPWGGQRDPAVGTSDSGHRGRVLDMGSTGSGRGERGTSPPPSDTQSQDEAKSKGQTSTHSAARAQLLQKPHLQPRIPVTGSTPSAIPLGSLPALAPSSTCSKKLNLSAANTDTCLTAPGDSGTMMERGSSVKSEGTLFPASSVISLKQNIKGAQTGVTNEPRAHCPAINLTNAPSSAAQMTQSTDVLKMPPVSCQAEATSSSKSNTATLVSAKATQTIDLLASTMPAGPYLKSQRACFGTTGSFTRAGSSIPANNPLVTQLLQGKDVPLEQILPKPLTKAEMKTVPLPSAEKAPGVTAVPTPSGFDLVGREGIERQSHVAAQQLERFFCHNRHLPSGQKIWQLFSGRDLNSISNNQMQCQEALSSANQEQILHTLIKKVQQENSMTVSHPSQLNPSQSDSERESISTSQRFMLGFVGRRTSKPAMSGHYLLNISTYGRVPESFRRTHVSPETSVGLNDPEHTAKVDCETETATESDEEGEFEEDSEERECVAVKVDPVSGWQERNSAAPMLKTLLDNQASIRTAKTPAPTFDLKETVQVLTRGNIYDESNIARDFIQAAQAKMVNVLGVRLKHKASELYRMRATPIGTQRHHPDLLQAARSYGNSTNLIGSSYGGTINISTSPDGMHGSTVSASGNLGSSSTDNVVSFSVTVTTIPSNQSGNSGGHEHPVSGQAFPGGSGMEDSPSKCYCRLKAMIMCKGCGAFCHDDCIGPSKLCVSCLVVR
ncbi:putative Polycomb group protein ASXL2 isoform X3 [Ascaphus truei]|uniref:putative Polycomb group protein ASXL2 isoform X3 n=1 Tax=Ascaphus truei TaxID=8439 RepID=UPI003F5A0BE6